MRKRSLLQRFRPLLRTSSLLKICSHAEEHLLKNSGLWSEVFIFYFPPEIKKAV